MNIFLLSLYKSANPTEPLVIPFELTDNTVTYRQVNKPWIINTLTHTEYLAHYSLYPTFFGDLSHAHLTLSEATTLTDNPDLLVTLDTKRGWNIGIRYD